MTDKRRKRRQALPYSSPVLPERQARIERQHNRDAMRRWAEETGVAERILNLIVAMVKERQGLPTDPKTWRIVRASEQVQEHSD